MGQHLALRVRTMLFGAMLRQEVGWFDMEKNSSGRLNTLLSRWASAPRPLLPPPLLLSRCNRACRCQAAQLAHWTL